MTATIQETKNATVFARLLIRLGCVTSRRLDQHIRTVRWWSGYAGDRCWSRRAVCTCSVLSL